MSVDILNYDIKFKQNSMDLVVTRVNMYSVNEEIFLYCVCSYLLWIKQAIFFKT